MDKLRKEVMEKVVKVVIPQKYLDDRTIYHIQPSGLFIIGGPQVIVVLYRMVFIA
jgi:S-adenosylmethionine synthetase